MRHFTALSMLCLLSLPAFAEEPAARACEYAVVRPLPSALCVAARADEFEKELARIREALPKVTVIGLVFDINASKKEDWIRLLDACRARGFKAVVQFSESGHDQPDWAYRPLKSEGGWNWSNLGEFVATRECIAHPALHSVFMIDEPWHHQKKPQYPTDDLKAMYADLKSRAPEGASFRIMAQFSREIGKKAKSKGPCRWEKGMCDIAMISALEFQDGEYQKAMLDENHEASRRIIHEATPGMPVWTTVQTLGRCYGPSPGYWFPRAKGETNDFLRILQDITHEKHEKIHPLSGVMFQAWDSETAERRPSQYTLGDRDADGDPVSQKEAAEEVLDEALEAIE